MDFSEQFKEALDNNDLEECSTLLYGIENIGSIGEDSWELSTMLCNYISKTTVKDQIEFAHNATMYICQLFGSPKELFLVYLENAESFFTDDRKYSLLVHILQTLLLRLSPRFIFHSLELALNQLNKPISRLTLELVNNQNELTEQRLMVFTNKFVDFLEVFIVKDQEDSTFNLKSILTLATVNLFNEPFMAVEFSLDDNMTFNTPDDEDQSNSSFSLVKRIFKILNTKLGHINFFKFCQELEFKCMYNDETETYKLSKNALCSFIAYAFTYDLSLEKPLAPKIYNHFFMFQSFIPIINFMLSNPSNESSLAKGLHVLKFYLSKLESKSLEGNLLELNSLVQTFQLLFRVSTYSTKETIRKEAVDNLRAFFHKFNRQGRYEILNYFLNDNLKDQTLNNYISSFLVYLFKEEVAETLDNNEAFYKANANFKRMFILIVKMKHGIKTDIMQESSKINGILNMLRFILIRDIKNETRIYDLLGKSEYLPHLKTAVEFCKGHYEQEKKNIIGMQKNDTSMKFEATTEGGEKINEPTSDDKITSCVNALQSLDLIELLRCRVVELLGNDKSFTN